MTGSSANALRPSDPRHDLLVRATLSTGPEALGAYQRWRSGVDLDTLDGPSLRMLPLLARRLDDAGIHTDGLAERVHKVARFTWLRTQMMVSSTLPALRALAERGVPAMLVKGAAVIHHTGMDLAARPMDDLDVCVPLASISAATHALVAAGFSSELESLLAARPAAVTGELPGVPFIDSRGVTVDLHWHLLHQRRHARSDDDFWAAATESQLRGVPCLVTSREDTLVHVLEHGAIWHVNPALQWTTDAALLLRGGGLDWDRVVWQSTRQRLARVVADGLEYLRGLGAAEVPEDALARLRAARVGRVETVLERAARLPGPAGVLARERRRDLEQDVAPGARIGPHALARTVRRSRAGRTGPPPAGLTRVGVGDEISGLLRPDGSGCPHLVAGWHHPERHLVARP
jgi:hypothetical protein